MTAIQKLDAVLSFLGKDTTWADIRTKFPDSAIPREEMKAILRKFYRDGYADRFSGKDLIPIDSETGYTAQSRVVRNYEGDIFVSEGGYSAHESNRKNLETLAIARDRMTRFSFLVNVSIAVSTGIAAIYYLVELFCRLGWINLCK